MKIEALRPVARWTILVGLIALGLVCLNSAAFSAWVAGGPPNDYPRAWAQRALVHLGYAVVSLTTGPYLFVALRPGFNIKKSIKTWIWFFLVVISLAYPKVLEHILIDKCLDSGGRWNNVHFECTK